MSPEQPDRKPDQPDLDQVRAELEARPGFLTPPELPAPALPWGTW